MKKKKKGSFFSGLLVFVLLIVLACTATVNLVFSSDRVPRIAGYYLYMQSSDDMEPTVPRESLVAAEAAVISELHEGNTVLCYLADGTLAIRKICQIEEAEDGVINYYPGTAKEQGVDSAIPRTNIFAVCVWASPELYWYINFATTVKGLMILLVAPCVILIIMLLAHLAGGSSDSMEDEEFTFEEEEPAPKKKKKSAPKPAPEITEEKKAPAKPVQEHEKTTKFKRQEIEEEALKVFDDPYPKQKKSSTQVFNSNQIREEARIQAQQQNMPAYVPPAQQIPPEPVPAPAPAPVSRQQEYVAPPQQMPAPEPAPAPVPEVKPEPPKPAPPKPAPAPKKPAYSSPNIDDILNANKKSRSAISSSDSIDDLIRLLEDEKKKL